MSLSGWRTTFVFTLCALLGTQVFAQTDAPEEVASEVVEEAASAAEAENASDATTGAPEEVSKTPQDVSEAPEETGEEATTESAETASEEVIDEAATTAEEDGSAESEVVPAAPVSSGVEALNEGIIGDNETSEYDLRIRELESRVNDLKERIFRSKAKLTLLTAALTGGSLGEGASLTIVHRNEMGGSYKLIEVNYFLDGAPLWQVNDDSGETLSNGDNKVVWDGNIVEGSHTLSVELVYRGTGYRLFNYHENYTFTLRDSYTFSIEAGQQFRVDAVGFERGNLTLEPEERPAVRFDTKLTEEAVLESSKEGDAE